MQYLLTQDEMNADLARRDALHRLPSIEKLQEFCTLVADTMPVQSGYGAGKPWQCILTVGRRGEWYCDRCPAKDICPHPNKHWSK